MQAYFSNWRSLLREASIHSGNAAPRSCRRRASSRSRQHRLYLTAATTVVTPRCGPTSGGSDDAHSSLFASIFPGFRVRPMVSLKKSHAPAESSGRSFLLAPSSSGAPEPSGLARPAANRFGREAIQVASKRRNRTNRCAACQRELSSHKLNKKRCSRILRLILCRYTRSPESGSLCCNASARSSQSSYFLPHLYRLMQTLSAAREPLLLSRLLLVSWPRRSPLLPCMQAPFTLLRGRMPPRILVLLPSRIPRCRIILFL